LEESNRINVCVAGFEVADFGVDVSAVSFLYERARIAQQDNRSTCQ